MKTLFDALEGIIDLGYAEKILSNTDHVISFASDALIDINNDQAESIIRVSRHWLDQQESGSGERERLREEAKAALICYLDKKLGTVLTAEIYGFEAPDKPSPTSRLKEVEWVEGEWVEV